MKELLFQAVPEKLALYLTVFLAALASLAFLGTYIPALWFCARLWIQLQ